MNETNENPEVKTSIQISGQFSGPIPSPELLIGYEQIEQGLANRIITMAEKEQNNRLIIEQKQINLDEKQMSLFEKEIDNKYKLSLMGLISGLIIALFGLGASTYLGATGKTWASGIMGAGTLGGLVAVFVKGTTEKNKDEN